MTPTTAQTPAQKFLAAPLIGGRPSVALRELKRRLQSELPAQIDYVNDLFGLSGIDAYEKPKDYLLAPVPVGDQFVCNLLIGHSVRSQVRGLGGANVLWLEVSLWIPDHRLDAQSQLLDGSDRAAMVAMVLEQYHGGCVDPDGRLAWTTLEPQPNFIGALPAAWQDYSGFSLNYILKQGAAATPWSTR